MIGVLACKMDARAFDRIAPFILSVLVLSCQGARLHQGTGSAPESRIKLVGGTDSKPEVLLVKGFPSEDQMALIGVWCGSGRRELGIGTVLVLPGSFPIAAVLDPETRKGAVQTPEGLMIAVDPFRGRPRGFGRRGPGRPFNDTTLDEDANIIWLVTKEGSTSVYMMLDWQEGTKEIRTYESTDAVESRERVRREPLNLAEQASFRKEAGRIDRIVSEAYDLLRKWQDLPVGHDSGVATESDRELLSAAKDGDTERVKELLVQGADPDAMAGGYLTPICRAALAGHKEVVVLLANAGASEALHAAALFGDAELVKTLLEKGVDVNAKGLSGKIAWLEHIPYYHMLPNWKCSTPLHLAVAKRYGELVAILVSAGADVNVGGESRETPLHWAAGIGDAGIASALLAAGADVNARDCVDETPLRAAAKRSHKEVVELLASAGADVNAKGEGDKTAALHEASRHGDRELVALLIDAGADVDIRDGDGRTPFHHSIDSASGKKVGPLLIAAGADVNAKDEDDRTPLHRAAGMRRRETVGILLAARADVNARDEDGQTPLHGALLSGDREIVLRLIAAGANVDAQDADGDTPLHRATGPLGRKALPLLVAAGADVNVKNEAGWTPLYWAVWMGYRDSVELLLAAGADTEVKDAEGITALQLAVASGKKGIATALIAAGAKVPQDAGELQSDPEIVAGLPAARARLDAARERLEAAREEIRAARDKKEEG